MIHLIQFDVSILLYLKNNFANVQTRNPSHIKYISYCAKITIILTFKFVHECDLEINNEHHMRFETNKWRIHFPLQNIAVI